MNYDLKNASSIIIYVLLYYFFLFQFVKHILCKVPEDILVYFPLVDETNFIFKFP